MVDLETFFAEVSSFQSSSQASFPSFITVIKKTSGLMRASPLHRLDNETAKQKLRPRAPSPLSLFSEGRLLITVIHNKLKLLVVGVKLQIHTSHIHSILDLFNTRRVLCKMIAENMAEPCSSHDTVPGFFPFPFNHCDAAPEDNEGILTRAHVVLYPARGGDKF